MKRIFQIAIISIFTAAVFGYGFAQKDVDIKSVSADFIQEKHLKILTKPLISKGRLFYKAPGDLRWEYFSPVRSILLVHEGQTKRYIIKDSKIIEDSSAKMQSMQVVMDEIAKWITGRFDENPDFVVYSKTQKTIILKPAKESFSKIINRIDIQLSDKEGVINSVMIHESEDSYTKLEFKNVILNDNLKDSLFTEI